MKIILLLVVATVLAGCSGIPREVVTGGNDCMQIGCETGGLVFYPHEAPEDRAKPGKHYEL